MLANNTGYAQGSGPAQGPTSTDMTVSHDRRKREYLSYLETKNAEIKEQQDARRYYHGAQYTDKQIKVFNDRKQPVVTYNRIGRKINAVVGLLERQRQDPRGFPRTPQHEEGAELATAVLRYICDQQEWPAKSPIAGLNGAVDGIGGIELLLEQGDQGDIEIGFEPFDPAGFFYDPRSMKADFSDARYMGVGKWADLEATIEMFPDKENELRASLERGTELTSNPDSDNKWFTDGEQGQRIRIVDHWYVKGGEWRYCVYTGSTVLAEGVSPFKDEKKRTICKYIAFSANIDHEGDRYGFVRNMRSSQDEINQRRAKGLHTLNSRRIFIKKGSGEDVEKIRKEMARPDGVVEYYDEAPTPDDGAKGQELQGHLLFLQDAKDEIENYGFNPALMGQGVDRLSGKAMQIQQQAGIAELGPYLLAYKGWKLRVYRALWCAAQEHWTGERWIRVTDDEQVAQFVAINQMGIDPATGFPAIVNAIGSLDVDIIIDEGPDTITMQQDTNETVREAMQSVGPMLSPPMAAAAMKVLIETSAMPASAKKEFREAFKAQGQPDPAQVAGMEAEIADKQAGTKLKEAQAVKALADAQAASIPQPVAGNPGPTDIDVAKALAEIRSKDAATAKAMAETEQTQLETQLMPIELSMQQREQERSRAERVAFKQADMTQQRELSRQPAGA